MACGNRAMRYGRRPRGFTLIELMVAVAVFVILAMLALPSFVTHLEKSRVRGAADALADQLLQARLSAVKSQRSVAWSMTGVGAAWCAGAKEAATPVVGLPARAAQACDCEATAVACSVDGRDAVISSVQHRGVQVRSLASAMVFDGRLGMRTDVVDSSGVELASATGRVVLAIRVSPLGHAAVCSKAGALLGVPAC